VVDGRRAALTALVGFLGLTAVATVLGGSRPALHQGVAPTVVQFAGYACALAGAALLLGRPGARGLGWAVLGALAVLLGLEVAVDGGGANIDSGAVRLVCLVAVVAATVRLARPSAAPGRR
jgi:hypothetical protein